MVVILDTVLFVFLMVILYKKQLNVKHYILFGAVIACSLFSWYIPFVAFKLLFYFALLMTIALYVPVSFGEVYAIVFAYFMTVVIGNTYNAGFEMWRHGNITTVGLSQATVFSVSVFVILAVYFSIMRPSIFKHQKMLTFMNKSSIYILVVLFVFLLLHEIGYMETLGIDPDVFYQLAFTIVYLFMVGNYVMAYLYYGQLNKSEVVLGELEYKYNDLAKISSNEKIKIIRDLRSLALLKDFDKILEYTEVYRGTVYSSKGHVDLEGIQDDYLSLVIQHKMNIFSDIHFVLDIEDFEVSNVSTEEEHFLEVFTIILDNAVEAALRSSEKIVRLLFKGTKITVSNTYNFEDLELFYSKESSKGDTGRINGLQLLSPLLEQSELIMVSTVDEMVNIDLMVMSND